MTPPETDHVMPPASPQPANLADNLAVDPLEVGSPATPVPRRPAQEGRVPPPEPSAALTAAAGDLASDPPAVESTARTTGDAVKPTRPPAPPLPAPRGATALLVVSLAATVAVAGFAFIGSFRAMADYAQTLGLATGKWSWTFPAVIDGTVIVSAFVTIARGLRHAGGWHSTAVNLLAVTVAVVVNVAHAPNGNPEAQALAAVFPVFLAACAHLVFAEVRDLLHAPARTAAAGTSAVGRLAQLAARRLELALDPPSDATLDDPGLPPLTPHQAGVLLEVIDDRHGLATIVTTNLQPAQLRAAVTEPVHSRLAAAALAVELAGPDRRTTTPTPPTAGRAGQGKADAAADAGGYGTESR